MTTESTFLELVLAYGRACERAAKGPKQKKADAADAIADRHDAFEAVKRAFRAALEPAQ